MLNISRSKDKQTIKFGQLIDIMRAIFFFTTHTENESGRLFPDVFLLFKKDIYEVKASGLQLNFSIFK